MGIVVPLDKDYYGNNCKLIAGNSTRLFKTQSHEILKISNHEWHYEQELINVGYGCLSGPYWLANWTLQLQIES